MGKLVDGQWQDVWYDTKQTEGKFVRSESQFRHRVSADGSSGFKAEVGRYHLYIAHACPWACRALIMRCLKQLQDVVSLSIVDPYMADQGWVFSKNPDCIPDVINGCNYLHEIYTLADPNYSGRVTVPVLWDKQQNTIVSNESAEIIRMFNREFNAFTTVEDDYYPASLAPVIDAINEKIYHNINNGVYKCGFATTQQAYEQAFDILFATLDELEELLGQQRYLVGDCMTEADWRLFTTLVRFDAVYVGHFKCNQKRIADYPHLQNYLRELYQYPGIAETVHMDHIKQHYYRSHTSINPTQVVPKGPQLFFDEN
ncbi:MAG: glutathione S-transferase family protein [Gammaproteobacteria bacterium]